MKAYESRQMIDCRLTLLERRYVLRYLSRYRCLIVSYAFEIILIHDAALTCLSRLGGAYLFLCFSLPRICLAIG